MHCKWLVNQTVVWKDIFLPYREAIPRCACLCFQVFLPVWPPQRRLHRRRCQPEVLLFSNGLKLVGVGLIAVCIDQIFLGDPLFFIRCFCYVFVLNFYFLWKSLQLPAMAQLLQEVPHDVTPFFLSLRNFRTTRITTATITSETMMVDPLPMIQSIMPSVLLSFQSWFVPITYDPVWPEIQSIR